MEGLKKSLALFVGRRSGHDGDVHTTGAIDLVVVNLGEDELLGYTHGEVATAVEALGRNAAEVADTRNCDGNQSIQELPHAVAAQGDLGADGHALTKLEGCDGLAGMGYDGLLTGDGAQVCNSAVDGLGVLCGLANAHVNDDLLELGNLVDVLVAKLLLQLVTHGRVILLLEAWYVLLFCHVCS